MDAATQIENAIPAGILYFKLKEVLCDKRLSAEKMEEEIKKSFKMTGMVLADVKVVKLMDNTYNGGTCYSIPVYIDSKGNFSPKYSKVINYDDFIRLQKYTKKIIKDLSKEILNGNIDIKPYRNMQRTACDYCQYKGICKFDSKNQKYFQIPNLEKQFILNKIKEEMEQLEK